MKALIIEDNIHSIKSLTRDLKDHFPLIEVMDYAMNVKEALEKIPAHEPQLLFMDVQLPDGTCFDILNKIDHTKYKIIFTSAHNEFAIKAFRFSAIDYLLKPINLSELKEAIERLNSFMSDAVELMIKNESIQGVAKKIALNTSTGLIVLNLNDILYIEALGNYCKFYTINERNAVMVSKTMKYFESFLQEYDFLRVHHSFLVNQYYIKKYSNKEGIIELKNDISIPVSQRKRTEIGEILKKI